MNEIVYSDAPDWYWYDGQTEPDDDGIRLCKFAKACMPLGNPNSDCELWREGRC